MRTTPCKRGRKEIRIEKKINMNLKGKMKQISRAEDYNSGDEIISGG